MASNPGDDLTAAKFLSEDVDDGEINVEYYLLPNADGIDDPYLKAVWEAAIALATVPDSEGTSP